MAVEDDGAAPQGNQGRRDVQARTVQGILALFSRQAFIYPLGLVASILLARMLQPAEFGIYALASFVVVTAASVSDAGLGAAFIQRATPPTVREQRVLFTFQLLLAAGLCALLYVLAPAIARFNQLDPEATWVFRAVLVTLLLGATNAVPTIQLERALDYRKFARLDVTQMLLYQLLAVGLAWHGYGVWSFVLASIAGAALRAVMLHALAPWPIGLAWDRAILRQALGFGGFFQLANMTALLRDNMVALLGGPMFGPRAVGYLNWAHGVALISSQIFSQLVSRVMFPSLSRLNDDPEGAREMLETSLRYLMLITLPVLGWLCVFMPEVVHFLYTDKWAAGIPAFYWYALGMVGGHFTTVLDAALKASGRVKRSLAIMTRWTVIDWALAVAFMQVWGFYGLAIAHGLAVWVAAALLVRAVREQFEINYRASVAVPMLAAAGMTACLYGLHALLPQHLLVALLLAIPGAVLYILLLWGMEGRVLVTDVRRAMALVKT